MVRAESAEKIPSAISANSARKLFLDRINRIDGHPSAAEENRLTSYVSHFTFLLRLGLSSVQSGLSILLPILS